MHDAGTEHGMHDAETEHGMNMGCGDTSCTSTTDFMAENTAMHNAMAIEFTCDPEVDLVRGMIPHHQGAVAMCRVLRESTSPGSGGDADSDPCPTELAACEAAPACVAITTSDPMNQEDCGANSECSAYMACHMTHGGRRLGEEEGVTLDPFLDELCTGIVSGQEQEIAEMEAWLTAESRGVWTCDGQEPIVHMGMAMGCGDSSCGSTTAYMQESMAMHDAMAIQFTCDPQVDFLRGMIAHHHGAVAMCRVMRDAMSGGAQMDGFVDGLCTGIVSAQEQEIAEMEAQLTDRGLELTTSCDGEAEGGGGHTMDGHPAPAVCNFQALLSLVGMAVAANDASMLQGEVYVACQATADAIVAGNTCP